MYPPPKKKKRKKGKVEFDGSRKRIKDFMNAFVQNIAF